MAAVSARCESGEPEHGTSKINESRERQIERQHSTGLARRDNRAERDHTRRRRDPRRARSWRRRAARETAPE